jgi:SAM-dependent methyltransferase
MPTVEWNQKTWRAENSWVNAGEEWSKWWGGTQMEWYGTLLPRIQRFIPAGSILEIAPGYGRWTQFLKVQCDTLNLVDLSETCIEACKKRFSDSSHISYFVNDGKSLDMIADNSVDLVFSFDSLVHVELGILKNYISQLPRILRKNGVAFLHHSNAGDYPRYQWIERSRSINGIPKLRGVLSKLGMMERFLHKRDLNVTAKSVRDHATACGLKCLSQELVNWGTRSALIDCISVIAPKDSPLYTEQETPVLRNPQFMEEAERLSRLSQIYSKHTLK